MDLSPPKAATHSNGWNYGYKHPINSCYPPYRRSLDPPAKPRYPHGLRTAKDGRWNHSSDGSRSSPGFPCPVSNSSRPSPHYRPGDGRRRSPALPAAPASPQTKHSAIHGQPSLSRDASLRHKRSYRNLSYERVLPKIPRTHRQMPHPDPTPPHANESYNEALYTDIPNAPIRPTKPQNRHHRSIRPKPDDPRITAGTSLYINVSYVS